MKRTVLILGFVLAMFSASAQPVYWVFLTDKAGTTFDPYSYFDAKAIERYHQCGADLYDITNYPLQQQYVAGVNALATEEVGQSRWMNAMCVVATPEQIAAIEALPYVLRVQPIEADPMQLASAEYEAGLTDHATVAGPLEAQLVRMGGKSFRDHGIDGKGIRIAVFDGGFPRVNTHDVFRHLRDNHQILKTWNFPNRKEDVYGWNSHGTMTLSCIAGRIGEKDLGLATGAEFLLARTEVEAEPFKEEVWWMQAVEWADQNGANIISSSLGYGKERHYTTDMDGTSYVARAGNLAARKGILVCNSAGNEADDKQWKTIITPSDADSVLCVGGIENSLDEYNHISFSSFGPSADGRLKPNVCAFGYARTADVPNDHATHYVHGTSFSCPLVAGFAACAWQASPGKTNMELFRMIEQSADLHPYYDYAFGYGVPQAAYFVGEKQGVEPTFRFEETDVDIRVIPTRMAVHKPMFFKEQRPDGTIVRYGQKTLSVFDTSMSLTLTATPGNTLVVHLDGYTAQCPGRGGRSIWGTVASSTVSPTTMGTFYRDEQMLQPSVWGSNAPWRTDFYLQLGLPVKLQEAELPMLAWSPSWRFGMRVMHAFGKVYSLGLGLEYGISSHNYLGMQPNALEQALGTDQLAASMDKVTRRRISLGEWGIEFFQRVRLVPLGLAGKGLHWDLGFYGNLGISDYQLKGKVASSEVANELAVKYKRPAALADYRCNYGVTTRLSYDFVGLYLRYRLNGLGQTPAEGRVLLPRLEAGLQLAF